MFGMFADIAENASEERVAADWEKKQARRKKEHCAHENTEAGIDEVYGAEDCEPTGRASRARDAFRRV